MARNIRNRLDRLDTAARDRSTEVLAWIRSGKRYAQLSDEQKDVYCEYIRVDRSALEEVCRMVCPNSEPDFVLYPLRNEVDPASIEEVEAYILQNREKETGEKNDD